MDLTVADDIDEGFFLFGLVTVNPLLLETGEDCKRSAELERGRLTWHCFSVTSFNGVLARAAVAVTKQIST